MLEGADRSLVARAYAERIAEAIAGYRRDREPAVVSRRGGPGACGDVGLFVAGFILRRLGRRIRMRVEQRFRSGVPARSSFQTFRVVTTEQMWAILLWLLRVAGGIAVLRAVLYFRYTLGLFPWTRGSRDRLFEIAIDPLRNMGLGLIGKFPNLVFLAALFLITRGHTGWCGCSSRTSPPGG